MAMRLGDLLCEANIVSQEMINYALNVQKVTGTRLGDTLKALKLATDYDIATVLATQAGLEYTDLDEINPSVNLIGNIPQDLARKYEALPIGHQNRVLLIAISDPFNEEMKHKIESAIIDEHRYVVAPRAALLRKIEHVYYLATHPLEEKIHSISNAFLRNEPFHEDKLVELIIESAIEHRASDIHINSSDVATMISYRIDGVLQLLYALPSPLHQALVAKIKQQCHMDVAERHRSQNTHMDFVFLEEKYDLRVSTVPTSQGENVVIRILSAESPIRSLAELGYFVKQRSALNHMVSAPYGLILAVGPTGTGKTTTLYSMARKINLLQKNLMSIEDPIEYEMPLVKQTSVNEKVGVSYASAIRDFLRQDPDALLIGEIRDEETAKLAVRAAQTGHLVLSTIHSNDASSAVSRLRELGINSMMIASSLTGIVAQRLARKLCRHCCKPVKLSETDRKRLNLSKTKVLQHVGCHQCHQTGYIGRTVVAEILEIDDEFRSLIDLGGSQLEIQEMARRKGIQSLAKGGIALIENGKIDIAEFFRIIRPSVRELGASDI
ncbi:GspE/PulE family protein [Pseudomonadota bacterium]